MANEDAEQSPSSSEDKPATLFGDQPVSQYGTAVLMLYLILVASSLLYGLQRSWPTGTSITQPTPAPAASPTASQPVSDTSATRATANTPSATATTTPSATATATPAATATATPAATATATPSASPSPTPSSCPGCPLPASAELFWLVILAGALGSTVHAIRSLFWYIGNRDLIRSWVPMYVLLPLNGATIAMVFHLIVLGGFVRDLKGTDTWLGLVGIAAMVGLFSQQASLKLRDIANALFTQPTPGQNANPQPTANSPNRPAPPALALANVTPNAGPRKGGVPVTLTGNGFADPPTVKFGSTPATEVKFVSATQITAKPPARPQSGKVEVEVTNPDGKSAKLPDGYTYQDEA